MKGTLVRMIAVTGITGLTGRFLIPAFRQQGYGGLTRCLVRPTSDRRGLPQDGVEYVQGDCTDVASLVGLVRGADILVHVAGIHTAEMVVAVCQQSGHRRVVFVNTTGMFSKYRKYATDYQRIEKIIIRSGLDYTIVRPTMIYGNRRDRNICRLAIIMNRAAAMPVIEGGRALMQPIYAEDLAWVIARAAFSPTTVGRAYNVAGKEPLTYAEVLQHIGAALGKKPRLISVPYWMALAAGYLGEVIPNSLVNVEKIKRLREDKTFDYSAARDELGFSPRPFDEGIRLEVAALRAEGVI